MRILLPAPAAAASSGSAVSAKNFWTVGSVV
jgi:hypothetical protein